MKNQKSRSKTKFTKYLKQILPYVATLLLILGIAKIGSDSKLSSNGNLNVNNIANSNYEVSADQLSELYVVASLSSSFSLASVDTVSGNYVTVSVMKEISQTSADKIEKPNYVGTTVSRGVLNHTVAEGETMASIAADYGLTTDQIRWSNNLKTTDVSVGQNLVLPSVPGIIYTAKSGDTPESLAEKYGSDAELIISINNLETSALTEGMQIVLPNGVLPEKERPEYVAPVVYTTYSYYGSTSDRQNVWVVATNFWNNSYNPMVAGQCTWYAWWWRATNPASLGPLPSGMQGNANVWNRVLANAGYRVDRTPEVGAVFQTSAGWYGHVGVVIGINDDGSIVVREMNYGYRTYVVTESTIPANIVGNFNYIH